MMYCSQHVVSIIKDFVFVLGWLKVVAKTQSLKPFDKDQKESQDEVGYWINNNASPCDMIKVTCIVLGIWTCGNVPQIDISSTYVPEHCNHALLDIVWSETIW